MVEGASTTIPPVLPPGEASINVSTFFSASGPLAGAPPHTAGATALDPDSKIDRLIMKRAEAQEQAREAANNKARHALRQQHERAQRRQGASRTTVAATLGLPLSGVDELMTIAEEGERGGS